MTPDYSDYNILIGKIVSTIGLKGEVKVWPYTDWPEHFEDIETVCVGLGKDDCVVHEIQKVRYHKSTVILKLSGIDSIEAAEKLRGMQIFIPEAELMPLGENQYYIHDVIGMDVVTTEGDWLGKISEVLRSPAHDIYVTDRAMIPAVKEFVVSVDLEKKRMLVKPIEGLIQA
ncbi:MAG: ribosome maturation factor RimM [Armatimonadetes bacterium]|nr:ribosome maturation factor RimM [Armatimonadota bacterium]